eukprot:99979_1
MAQPQYHDNSFPDEKKQHDKNYRNQQNVVLSFGKNDKFQTGHKIKNNIFKPLMITSNHMTNPIYIATGFDHSGIIDTNGKAILWGDNSSQQISNYKYSSKILPHTLSLSMKVTQIALSSNSSLFLDSFGNVWTVGANSNDLSCIKFPFNTKKETINSISCGYQHYAALSNRGKLYLWGNNKYSQLGLSSAYQKKNYIISPMLLQWQTDIIKCVLGRWHSLILTANGSVYSCGWGRFGVLGLGNTYNQNEFKRVYVTKNDLVVSDIKCGAVHSCCVANGNVYVWGRGKYGRVGLGNEQNVLIPTFLKCKFEKKGDTVYKIELGGDNGMIISKFGDVYVWGKTLEGQLGFYTNKNVLSPVRLRFNKHISNNYEPVDCSLGDCHSVILMSEKVQRSNYYNAKNRSYRTKNNRRGYYGSGTDMDGQDSGYYGPYRYD